MPGEDFKLNFGKNHHLSTHVLGPGRLAGRGTGQRAAGAGQPPAPRLHPIRSSGFSRLSSIPPGTSPLRAGCEILPASQRFAPLNSQSPRGPPNTVCINVGL